MKSAGFDLRRNAEYATAALAEHERVARFEGDETIQIWQLIVSLRRLCDLHGHDWREIFADALKYRDWPDEERQWPSDRNIYFEGREP